MHLHMIFFGLLSSSGVVKKKRLLYLVGQTRVHCDEVEGLGCFMELEVGFSWSMELELCFSSLLVSLHLIQFVSL